MFWMQKVFELLTKKPNVHSTGNQKEYCCFIFTVQKWSVTTYDKFLIHTALRDIIQRSINYNFY